MPQQLSTAAINAMRDYIATHRADLSARLSQAITASGVPADILNAAIPTLGGTEQIGGMDDLFAAVSFDVEIGIEADRFVTIPLATVKAGAESA